MLLKHFLHLSSCWYITLYMLNSGKEIDCDNSFSSFFESENIDCSGNDSLITVVILSTTYVSCSASRLLVHVRKSFKNTSKVLLVFDFMNFSNELFMDVGNCTFSGTVFSFNRT